MKTWRDVLRFILSVGAFFLAVYLLNLMGGPARDATDAAQGRTYAQQHHLTSPASCPKTGRRAVVEGCQSEASKGENGQR